MTWSGIAICMFLFTSAAFAQGTRGTITGTITNPDGGLVTGALVQAKHSTTGMVYRTESIRRGSFTLSGLPAGTYELSVPEVGFLFDRHVQKGAVTVQAGQTVRNDIRLSWGNAGVLGDDMYLDVHNKYSARKLTGPTPRTAGGKPDLSGVWTGTRDPDPEKAEALPWVDGVMQERFKNDFRDLPSADCLPGDVVPSAPLLYKIVQTPGLVVQLFEADPHFRQVFLDGRPHPKDLDPTWTGHSIGKWEGETLVIDTVGFNDKSWLPNLMPHTEKLHIVERYRRPDLAHLNVEIKIEDPATLKKPWNIRMVWELAPDEEILETICNENNRFRELAGDRK